MSAVSYPAFRHFEDSKGGHYWIFYVSRGEEIARSSERYIRKEDCERSIELMRACGDAPYFPSS